MPCALEIYPKCGTPLAHMDIVSPFAGVACTLYSITHHAADACHTKETHGTARHFATHVRQPAGVASAVSFAVTSAVTSTVAFAAAFAAASTASIAPGDRTAGAGAGGCAADTAPEPRFAACLLGGSLMIARLRSRPQVLVPVTTIAG